MSEKYLGSLTLGALSAFASYILFAVFNDIYLSAGIVFGSVVAWKYRAPFFSRAVPFVLISSTAYLSAVIVALNAAEQFRSFLVALPIAGAVGATILILGFHFLIRKLRFSAILTLMAVGSILGLTFLPSPSATLGSSYNLYFNVFMLYMCWQIGMLIGLQWVLEQKA
jgi:hypothetical protein